MFNGVVKLSIRENECVGVGDEVATTSSPLKFNSINGKFDKYADKKVYVLAKQEDEIYELNTTIYLWRIIKVLEEVK